MVPNRQYLYKRDFIKIFKRFQSIKYQTKPYQSIICQTKHERPTLNYFPMWCPIDTIFINKTLWKNSKRFQSPSTNQTLPTHNLPNQTWQATVNFFQCGASTCPMGPSSDPTNVVDRRWDDIVMQKNSKYLFETVKTVY